LRLALRLGLRYVRRLAGGKVPTIADFDRRVGENWKGVK
jgi:hypothetical protein